MEAGRVYNFNPGPATLPLEVLKEAQAEFLNFNNSGMSILEISHRAPQYAAVHEKAKQDIKELMGLGDDYEVLFCQGGASQQFAMIPLNFATKEHPGSYVLSGSFAEKAYKEAELLGVGEIVASSKETGYHHVPQQSELKIDPNAAYVHVCYNNTIYGTRWDHIPDTGDVPLVADMSSNILSEVYDVRKFGVIYAGAQKNVAPAGVVILIVREDLLGRALPITPKVMDFAKLAAADSMLNTPNCFGIYVAGLTFKWIKAQGGVAALEARNIEKAKLLYDYLDESKLFTGTAQKRDRSRMNVTFVTGDAELDAKFVKEAAAQGLVNLKGHRIVGGMRASIYNAMPVEGVQKLVDFMKQFETEN